MTERNLTGCENVRAQDVIRGELDVLYEGTGKLKCLRCDVNCSSGKDANRHWIEVHGESAVGYTCGKCKKKFERLTQVSCHYARCRGQTASAHREEDSKSDVSFAARDMIPRGGLANI